MKELRRKIDRFLYNNRSKGIPNLMLLICIGTFISYFVMLADKSGMYYTFMRFDRSLILHGQIWRLFSYVFLPQTSGLWLFLLLFAYYGIGRMVERVWGTLKFNLFYLCGILIIPKCSARRLLPEYELVSGTGNALPGQSCPSDVHHSHQNEISGLGVPAPAGRGSGPA